MTSFAQQKTPHQVIDEIRSSIVPDLDSVPDGVKVSVRNLQTQLSNALHLLSHDLYSEKSHFVLELVQNADDNSYEPDVTPHLTFEVTPDRLVVVNNEKGFQHEHIRAICSTGASSKSKDKTGYIGEKGIGFKSVFTVSDAPEIHSNGFHIKFDRTDEENLLGYIVPEWCEPRKDVRSGCTTIILPAAGAYEFGTETLVDLDARLLLFLNTLRQLTLAYDGQRVTYRRQDEGAVSHLTTAREVDGGDVELEKMRYVRVSSSYAMEGAHADSEKRAGIGHSTIIMAFPIDVGGAAKLEPASNVFAFLPIRQMGFKFPIQADFILSSSREGILTARPWNQFLRDQIADVFCSAVEIFKKTEALSLSYLKYVPAEGEISDPFFRTIRKAILAKLSMAECLRSASGVWKRPNELRRADSAFRSLFPSKHAVELFDFDYVDAKTEGGNRLLQDLGVEEAGSEEIIAVFKDRAWLQGQPFNWRVKLYAYVAKNQPSLIAAGLLDCPCLPTSDGSCVIPAESTVFFPLSRKKKYGFESELVFVDGDLYEAASERSPQVVELFEAMQVKASEPYDLVVEHILPRHKGDAWKTSGHKALIGHLRYIKEKLADYLEAASAQGKTESQAYQILRAGIYVGTKHVADGTWLFDRIGSLYLGKEYAPKFCIESQLGSVADVRKFVSPDYLATKPKDMDAEVDSWRQFFIDLGVRLAPFVESEGINSNSNSKCSDELQRLLESTSSAVRKATLECMSSHWADYSSHMTYRPQFGRTVYGPTATKFAESLRAARAPSKKRTVVALSESYYPTQELKTLLGEALPYVDAQLQGAMLDACHVTHRLDAKALVKRLKQIADEPGGTPKQVQAIYRALDERFWHSEGAFIKKSFEEDELIQLKSPSGEWFRVDEVTWRPSSAFLDSLYPPLQGRYRDFSKFFLDKLGVSKELPIARRVDALARLSEVVDPSERTTEALLIYRRANQELGPRFGKEVPTPDWIGVFETEAVYITHRGEMVENDENLFANDAPQLAALFEDDDDLLFLAVPPEEVPRLSRLFDLADVSRLSASVAIQVDHADSGLVNEDLTSRVRRSVGFFARVLYSKAYADFDRALSEGRFEDLRMFEIVEVSQVALRVVLGDCERETTVDIARNEKRVLYRAGLKSVGDLLSEELSKFLISSADLADTFARILMEKDIDGVEDFLKVRHIEALPPDLQASLDGTASLSAEDNEVADASNATLESPSDVGTDRIDDPSEQASDSEGVTPVGAAPSDDAPPQVPTSSNLVPETEGDDASSFGDLGSKSARGTPTATPVASDSKVRGEPRSTDLRANSLDGNGVQDHSIDSGEHADPSEGDSSRRSGARTGFSPTQIQSAGHRKHGQSQPPRTKAGRLISYAADPNALDREHPEDDPAKVAARKATERAAVEFFIATQAGRWKSLTEMPPNNPGFDFSAFTDDGQEEYIEVKGQSGAWTEEGVALTPKELITAGQKGNSYWLCVVEYAHDDRRRQLHLVRNLYGLIQQFRFDVGWKSVAETDAQVPLKPEKDLYIDMSAEGRGKIMSVRRKGRFFSLHVILDDGRQINRLYNPAKMTLSEEPTWQE